MNCTTCRMELSRCLDGRLPSGRHATVMAHTEACDECAEFLLELEAARRLALRAPIHAVSAEFHDGLWKRIRAGEGTPDAVFREPVSTLTKLRYLGTGAAAAAAMLLVANQFAPGRGDATTQPRADHATNTARAPEQGPGPDASRRAAATTASAGTGTSAADSPMMMRLAGLRANEPLQPFEPDRLALAAASNVSQTHHDLDLLLCSPDALADEQRALAQVRTIHEMGMLLLDLQDEEFITLDSGAQKLLTKFVYQADPAALQAFGSPRETLQVRVRPLIEQTRELRNLPFDLSTRVRNDRERFFRQLRLNRELAQALSSNFLVVPFDETPRAAGSWSTIRFPALGQITEQTAGQLFFINLQQLDERSLRALDPRLNSPSVRYMHTNGAFTIQICIDEPKEPGADAAAGAEAEERAESTTDVGVRAQRRPKGH